MKSARSICQISSIFLAHPYFISNGFYDYLSNGFWPEGVKGTSSVGGPLTLIGLAEGVKGTYQVSGN